ncbi:MAG TPA: hypothetical protein DCQ83_07425 [Fibrobacteres bacterium]|nr:hypothetical protein [Fibrobacterota bacterium]
MKRFWKKEKLDKYSADPTIHQSLADAFERAALMTNERKSGHFAVFECIGFLSLSKKKKKPGCEPAS